MDSIEASTKSQDELSDNLDEWEENTCGNADVMGWDDEENSWMCGIVIID